jgi:RecA/RadA recombinase
MSKDNSKLPPFKLANIVDFSRNPFNYIINTHSPSFNWIFGNSHGLPLGYGMLLWGEAKSGKTLITNDITAKVHADYPDAWVIRFDTEWRSNLQDNGNIANIDKSRYIVSECNTPSEVFDTIKNEIAAQCQAGRDIKLIIIDSLNGINGIRELTAESVENQSFGDMAMTLQKGLKSILPVIRKYNIALICTAHSRAEMDQHAAMRNKIKPGVSYAALHSLEYHVQISANKSAAGRIVDDKAKDMMKKDLITGHKIRAVMTASSCSPAGRTAEFTLDYEKGIVNIGEEVAFLSTNIPGIVEMPNNRTYIFGDQKWLSWDAYVNALDINIELRDKITEAVKKTDLVIRL